MNDMDKILIEETGKLITYEEYFKGKGFGLDDYLFIRVIFEDEKIKAIWEQEFIKEHGEKPKNEKCNPLYVTARHKVKVSDFHNLYGSLKYWNANGYAIYLVVNGGGNDKKEVKKNTSPKAQFWEKDDGSFEEQMEMINGFSIRPSELVRTKKSIHCYAYLNSATSQNDWVEWRSNQKKLAEYFHADEKIIDECRLLRIPGFHHMKDKDNPVLVTLVRFEPENRYSIEEIKNALPNTSNNGDDDQGEYLTRSVAGNQKVCDTEEYLDRWFFNHDIEIVKDEYTIQDTNEPCIRYSIQNESDIPWANQYQTPYHAGDCVVLIRPNGMICLSGRHDHDKKTEDEESKWHEFKSWHEKKSPSKTYIRDSRDNRRQIYKSLNSCEGEWLPIESFIQGDPKNLPSFNPDWLPFPFNEYCRTVSENVQVATDMIGTALLTVVSSAIQKKYYLKVSDGYKEPLNLYMVNIAYPSERKSPVLKTIESPILDYQKSINQDIAKKNEENQTNRELLKKEIANAKKKNDMETVKTLMQKMKDLSDVPPCSYLCSDITTEALAGVMKENGEKTGIFSAEGGIFQTMAGLYNEGKSNIDLYLQAYSNEYVSIRRVTRGVVELYHPSLTMLLFVQPTIIQQIMCNEEFKGRGLLARFGYVFPKSIVGSRKLLFSSTNKNASKNYKNAITDILMIPERQEPTDLILSEKAIPIVENYYNKIEAQIPESKDINFDDWMGKCFGQFLRIIGILHVMKYKQESEEHQISCQTVNIGVEIEEYLMEHSKFAYSGMGERGTISEQKAKYILKKIMELVDGCKTESDITISMQELWQKCRGKYDTREKLQEGLEELVLRHYIRIKTTSNGNAGRPNETVQINKSVFVSNS